MVAVAKPSTQCALAGRPIVSSGRPDPSVVLRRRLVVAALAAAMVVGAVWLALQVGPGRPAGGPFTATGAPVAIRARPVAARVWVVSPGETVWGIVQAVGVKGDPRPMVDRLTAQLGGRALQPGERLLLP